MKNTLLKKHHLITLLVALITLILITSLCACNQNDGKIKVKDIYGQTKTFEKPLTRLVGSHNPTLNSVVAVGGGGKYLCGFGFKEKADGLYSEVIENWNSLPTVYDNHDFDMQAIKSMNAELAILPESQQKREKEFKEAGVDSFFVQPKKESLEVVKETIRKIGALVNENERAENINKMFDEIINDVKSKTSKCSADKKIIFMGTSLEEVVPSEMIQNNIIEEAKGINAVTEYDKTNDNINLEPGQYAKIDPKTLADINPDIIIIPNYAKFGIEDVINNSELKNVKAVINKQVYIFPSKLEPWDYSTLSCCLGICYVANLLHPNEFSRNDLLNTCNKFYTTLYNKEFSEEKLGI